MTKRHGGEIALWTWAMVPTRLLERVPRKEGVWRAGECRPSISRLRSRQQPTALSTIPATHASADSALCRADIVASCKLSSREADLSVERRNKGCHSEAVPMPFGPGQCTAERPLGLEDEAQPDGRVICGFE